MRGVCFLFAGDGGKREAEGKRNRSPRLDGEKPFAAATLTSSPSSPLSRTQDPSTLRLSAFDLSSSRGTSQSASRAATPVNLGAPLSASAVAVGPAAAASLSSPDPASSFSAHVFAATSDGRLHRVTVTAGAGGGEGALALSPTATRVALWLCALL